MNYTKALLIGLTIILMGCQQSLVKPTKPTKPTLQIQKQIDGGICLSKDNAAKLGAYILELERQ